MKFYMMLYFIFAGYSVDGAGATAPLHRAADYHPLSVRRFAPSIKRLQRTVVPTNKFAYTPDADPQPVVPHCQVF